MSNLYMSTCYGYEFLRLKTPDFLKWLDSQESEDYIEKYEENRYDIKEKGKICIDDESYITFAKRLSNQVICVYEGCMFPVGQKLKLDNEECLKVEKDFEEMLNDPKTPDVFRNRDDWELVGTIFSVTS